MIKGESKKEVDETVSTKNKTNIADRLEIAADEARSANRNSDLGSLNNEFGMMRSELKVLIIAAKRYHDAVILLDKARMDMVLSCTALATHSPIFLPIGNTQGHESLATVAVAASMDAHMMAKSYEETVVDYCIEWERVVTTRVDTEFIDTNKLNQRLIHYQNKVQGLRNKANATEKLTRNEQKLNQAWRAHYRSASKLCNLLDEVTKRGWKDVYPLVRASMQWEFGRASLEYDVFAKLPAIMKELTELAEEESAVPSVQDASPAPIAMTDDDMESETTGSLRPDEDEDPSSDGADADEEDEMPASPERTLTPKLENKTFSPNSVEHV